MENRVSSKENRIYRTCRKLAQKKYRDREGRYLIEGENLIGEALENGAELEQLILCEGGKWQDNYPVPCCVMEPKLFRTLSQTETSQGILGIVRKKLYRKEELAELFREKNLVILDRLQDPGNIGTIIRTAEGAGYGGVICVRGTGDVFSPKVVRAAAGSLFRIPVVMVDTVDQLCSMLGNLGKRLVVTSLEGSVNYYETDLSHNIALVIGNEGNGVSHELLERAETRLKIPMAGKLESLNASVAAGILMYEAMRNNKR